MLWCCGLKWDPMAVLNLHVAPLCVSEGLSQLSFICMIANIWETRHLWMLVTLWACCTCKNVSHLPVSHHRSVDVTQSEVITAVCLLGKLRLYCCVPTTQLYWSSREVTCVWTV